MGIFGYVLLNLQGYEKFIYDDHMFLLCKLKIDSNLKNKNMKKVAISLFVFCAFLEIVSAQQSKKIKLNPVDIALDLPMGYKERTFIRGLAGFTNKIDQLVGSMILIEDSKTIVLTRFVKQDAPPLITSSTSDVIYSAKINSKFKLNGNYAIASTKVENNSVYELIVTDVGIAFLNENTIPYLEICQASKNVSPQTKKNTYYVRSAKLTTIYTKAFKKVEGATNVSGTVFSIGGEVYSSSDNFRVDYVVSVDIVSLDKLLSLHNCDQIISSEELKAREKAEKARQEAIKAEEEKKAKETELNAKIVEIELLKKEAQQTTELKEKLREAEEKERQLKMELEKAKKQSDELTLKAKNDEKNAQDKEKSIITFKNKDGKTLEIKSLEELSPEKLKELGFDVEILKESKK
jgi:hypothetical protein